LTANHSSEYDPQAMAIRFQCSGCSQPIEVDDEWAQKFVACPYCRRTITAPAESTLPDPSQIPTATRLEQPQVPADLLPPFGPTRPAVPTSNVIAKVAFGLACTVVVTLGLYCLIGSLHQAELEPLIQPERTFSEQMQAFQEYTASRGGMPPGWMMAMSLLSLTGVVMWVAALVCGIVGVCRPSNRSWAIAALVITAFTPLLFCCGGIAFMMPG
jgi:hypothetical protein